MKEEASRDKAGCQERQGRRPGETGEEEARRDRAKDQERQGRRPGKSGQETRKDRAGGQER